MSESKIPNVVTLVFIVTLLLGIVFLFMSASQIVNRAWGGFDNGVVWDVWGIEIYPDFITYLTISIAFIIVANLLYIVGTWVVSQSAKPMASSMYKLYSIAGLFLPTIFGYGVPRVSIYGDIRFGNIISPIIAPLYSLDCSIFLWDQFTFTFAAAVHYSVFPVSAPYPNPFLSIGSMTLYLGLLLAIGLLLLEKKYIRYHTFTLFIVLNIVFSIVIMMNVFSTFDNWVNNNPYLFFSIPSYSLGALFLGKSVSKRT